MSMSILLAMATVAAVGVIGTVALRLHRARGSTSGPVDPKTTAFLAQLKMIKFFLPMSSGGRVQRGERTRVSSRTGDVAYCPRRIIIGGDPGAWVVDDITVDGRSQIAAGSAMPGEAFSIAAMDTSVSLDVVGAGSTLEIAVTYVGQVEAGEVFECSVICDMVSLPATGLLAVEQGRGVRARAAADVTDEPR